MARRTDAQVPLPQLDDTATADLPPMGTERADSASEQFDTATAPAVEGEAPKKRRRRRKATPQPEATESNPATIEETNFAQAIAMGFDFGGRIAAGLRGDHWLFKPEETQVLGQVWAKALIPYMGSLAPYTPFIVATIVTAGYMMPKVQTDRLLRAENVTPIRRVPVQASIDGPSASAIDANASSPDLTGSPELSPAELGPDTLGGAAARRSRKRGEMPPGVS